MSAMILTLVGNAGEDPELKYTNEGEAVCKLSVAAGFHTANGEKTTWFRATAWGKPGEVLAQYVKKGDEVTLICDRVAVSTYDGRDGSTKFSLDVNVMRVVLNRNGGKSERQAAGSSANDDVPF